MESASPSIEPPIAEPMAPVLSGGAEPLGRVKTRRASALTGVRFAVTVYLLTRVMLLVVALVDGALRHHGLTSELSNWDGLWYLGIVNHGYPGAVSHHQSNLGFFPGYPMLIWLVARPLVWLDVFRAATISGILISLVGGLIATVAVQRLAESWWGEESARRATAAFCLFPGSVVFSMVYSEGVLIPLAAATILALQRRRWVTAGILAGLATAIGPTALMLIAVCAIAAARELHRRGIGDRSARRSLLAPVLSLTGVVGFAAYLWLHAGTPFASLLAQRYGWHEKTDPIALVHLVRSLGREISFSHFNHPTINLNLVAGVIGALVLFALLAMLWRARRGVPLEAFVWTLGIAFLAVTSEYVPPNPRMLITAFPAVAVLGHQLRGRRFTLLMLANGVLLAGLSALTFVGVTLRP